MKFSNDILISTQLISEYEKGLLSEWTDLTSKSIDKLLKLPEKEILKTINELKKIVNHLNILKIM